MSDDGSAARDQAGPSSPAVQRGPPSRRVRNLVVGAAIGFFVMALVADTVLLSQVDRHPALFIAMNARNRNLALAKSFLSWEAFFGIATVRLLASDPLFFLLGRWYGDDGVRWIEQRSATYGPLARGAERWFGKASYPLVLLAPNNYICLFAGASGMSVAVFGALNVAGTIGRLTVLWFVTDSVAEPLDWVRSFIADHRLLVFGVSLALLAFTLWSDRRAGGGEIDSLLHLDDEIGGDDEPEGPRTVTPRAGTDPASTPNAPSTGHPEIRPGGEASGR